MNQFCTLFNSKYLSRGLCLYSSLLRHNPDAFLTVFAFDDVTLTTLLSLNLPSMRVVSLAEFETAELLKVKTERSLGEYCWTCTPAVIEHCLEKFQMDSCTYLDADLYFWTNAKSLFEELGDRSVMITEHRYTPEYDKTQISGKYCVQFMTFRNNPQGRKALSWWKERCLEWCFNRIEDGKFGDQKYLDDWTERFEGVHSLKHLGGGLAPWNIQQYDIVQENPSLKFCEKSSRKTFDGVFFHFHQLAWDDSGVFYLGTYELSQKVKDFIYFPYMREVLNWEDRLGYPRKNLRLRELQKQHFPRAYDFKIFLRQWIKGQRFLYLMKPFYDSKS